MERSLLTILFLGYFCAAFLWPTWRVWRATGNNPYVLPSTDDAHGFVTSGFRLVIAGLVAYVVAQAAWPETDALLGPLGWMSVPSIRAAGWGLLMLALAWTVLAQYQMGLSWRIGLDHQHRTGLVTSGVFRHSRNPIFLGMRTSLLSLVLLRPNAATIALALAADVLIQVQVRLEEEFLMQQHGAAYAAYKGRTRRWL